MTTNAGVRKVIKGTILAMAMMLLLLGPSAAQAALVDITTLPGYQVVTTNTLNFGDGGLAGWSVANNKVILGAKIISAGDSVSDFSVFRPTKPGETWNGYTLGANEYGFAFADVNNGASNPGVQIELYYANMPAGYTITTSSTLNYSSTGWGGWSAPAGDVVSGGGFQFSNIGASAASSQFADNGSVWPHYTFGAGEQGWVVQSAQVGGQANIYVISFDAQAVPIPAAVWLLGSGIVGLVALRRKAQK